MRKLLLQRDVFLAKQGGPFPSFARICNFPEIVLVPGETLHPYIHKKNNYDTKLRPYRAFPDFEALEKRKNSKNVWNIIGLNKKNSYL